MFSCLYVSSRSATHTHSKRPTVDECRDHKWMLETDYTAKKRERAVFFGTRLRVGVGVDVNGWMMMVGVGVGVNGWMMMVDVNVNGWMDDDGGCKCEWMDDDGGCIWMCGCGCGRMIVSVWVYVGVWVWVWVLHLTHKNSIDRQNNKCTDKRCNPEVT